MISRDDQFDGWLDACDGYEHQRRRWQGDGDLAEQGVVDRANDLNLTVSDYAQMLTAGHLETISYFLFHLVKFAERKDSKPRTPKRRQWAKKGKQNG